MHCSLPRMPVRGSPPGRPPRFIANLSFFWVHRLNSDKARNANASWVYHYSGDFTVRTRENVNLAAGTVSVPVVYLDGNWFASLACQVLSPGGRSVRYDTCR